jgi:hypothetical protein
MDFSKLVADGRSGSGARLAESLVVSKPRLPRWLLQLDNYAARGHMRVQHVGGRAT